MIRETKLAIGVITNASILDSKAEQDRWFYWEINHIIGQRETKILKHIYYNNNKIFFKNWAINICFTVCRFLVVNRWTVETTLMEERVATSNLQTTFSQTFRRQDSETTCQKMIWCRMWQGNPKNHPLMTSHFNWVINSGWKPKLYQSDLFLFISFGSSNNDVTF